MGITAVHWDGTISTGTIIEVVTILAAMAILYSRLVAIETKLEAVWDWFTTNIIRGQRGATGDTGSQGSQGSQGERGTQGERGERGTQGSQGERGSARKDRH